MTTPNMGLTQNVIGVTTDPTWSNNITGDFNIIDTHNHVPVSLGGMGGVQITQAGLNITGDMSFNSFNITGLRSWRMQPQSSTLAGANDMYCGYFVNGNFYINNSTGFAVQITNGNAINIASAGGIGGDYASSGALVYYTNAISTYTFTNPASQVAAISSGPITIQRPGSAFGTTIQNPTGATGNVTITSFAAQPTAGVLSIDGAGQLSTSIITSGTYNPTTSSPTGYANGTITVRQHNYTRIGNIVTVTGGLSFSGGTASTSGGCNITLPVATANFTSQFQANGPIASAAGAFGSIGVILANTGAQTVNINTLSLDSTNNLSPYYTFSYQIQ